MRFLPPVFVAAAAYVAVLYVGQRRSVPGLAVDLYQYFYPNVVHALRALANGGRGLLWNPFQNCGQPFFAISQTGLLYPANLVFLALRSNAALHVLFYVELLVGALGTYGLCRELGVGVAGAVVGALAFDLGPAMASLSTWNPMVAAPYAWLPASAWLAERMVRDPSLGRGVVLGVVLGVSLLAGFPQIVLFAYQLVALRVVFELATRRGLRPWRLLAATAVGFAVGPLLAAVQLVPSMIEVRDSLRSGTLSVAEMSLVGFLDFRRFRQCVGSNPPPSLHVIMGACSPFVIVPSLLATVGMFRRGTRCIALFYLLVGLGCFVLAFGPNTPLFGIYLKMPFAGLFRGPERLLWITDFCLAVLAGLGMDAVASGPPAAAPVAMAAVLGALWVVGGGNWSGIEVTLAVVTVVATGMRMLLPRVARIVAVLVFAAVVFDLALLTTIRPQRLLPTSEDLFTDREAFAQLRAAMTDQNRAYPFPGGALFAKSASLFAIPGIDDYEPLTARRYAEFFMMMRTGAPLTSVHDYHWRDIYPIRLNERLLALTAARYLVLDPTGAGDPRAGKAIEALTPHPTLVPIAGRLAVYENRGVLPRAFYVPRIEVVPDAGDLLHRLAFGADDLHGTALVEAPVSTFRGVTGDGRGEVTFVRDEPEDLELAVEASQRGFLFLADEYAPGWRATVDDRPAAIARANYAFRLVEVPIGRSTVRFRYAEPSGMVGALISAVTFALVAGAAYAGRRAAAMRSS